MILIVRLTIIAISVAEAVAWTFFTSSLWQLGNAFGGSGDGAGSHGDSNGEMLAALIIAVVWLGLTSPYLCMATGALNLMTGKSLRVAYSYTMGILALMTLIELMTMQRVHLFGFMALGNIVAGGLWAFGLRSAFKQDTSPK